MKRRGGLLLLLLAGIATSGYAALRPEASGWKETSRSQEVIDFLTEAAERHPRIHYTTLGYSLEGRELPLLVVGPETLPDPERARESNQLRIYFQGNIHAGEVAGKEALLRLVRNLSTGEREPWTRDWILLINPNYNPDGNDRIHLENRLLQHGPMGGMGTRENAQGLDLNRDQMKLDAPESRALAKLLSEWDPHVLVDMHTTNGTFHGYHLTYSPPLHPGTPDVLATLLYEDLLPEISQSIEASFGWRTWHYGNLSQRQGEEGWYTFDPRPRYVTNYMGLRNRIGILSEAYSYLSFEDRILASERFAEAILQALLPRRESILDLLREADALDLRGTPFPLHGVHAGNPPVMELILGEVEVDIHPYTGGKLYRRTEEIRKVEVPTSIRFQPADPIVVPEAYLVSGEAENILERLRAHGIHIEVVEGPINRPRQYFHIEGRTARDRAFQGRVEKSVTGEWRTDTELPLPPVYQVPMAQPLARLAILLLEPESPDGFLHWGFYDDWLQGENPRLPVWRVPFE